MPIMIFVFPHRLRYFLVVTPIVCITVILHLYIVSHILNYKILLHHQKDLLSKYISLKAILNIIADLLKIK